MPSIFKNKKIIILFSAILFLIIGGFCFWNLNLDKEDKEVSAAGESWLTGWEYRKPVSITNNNGNKIGTANGNLTALGKINGSMSFDGTGDYLSVPASSDFNFGTGDFTVDFWMKAPSQANNKRIYHTGYDNGFEIELISNKIAIYGPWGSHQTLSTTTVADGTWRHIALVKSSGIYSVYVNGVKEGSYTNTASVGSATNAQIIGRYWSGSYEYTGYLDEFRISNKARWTVNFTPATLAYSPDAYTRLLLHFDQLTTSTTLTSDDSTSKTATIYGNPFLSGVFGGGVGFDGSGDYVAFPSHTDFALGTGDFTYDFRVRFNVVTGYQTIFTTQTGYIPFLRLNGAEQELMLWMSDTGSVDLRFPWAPVAGTWYHIAVVRSGTSLKMFVNGTQIGTTKTCSESIPERGFWIGKQNNASYDLNGQIDEFRISNTARWTGAFTPETSPYSYDANTKLLMHFEEPNGSTSFYSDETPETLTDYQTKITVPYISNMKSDFSDLRFTSSDGVTLLDYWIESYTASSTATVWVENPSLTSSNTIYMYYGKSDATSLSNGTNTFVFFDDFNNLSNWTQQAGSWTVSSGILASATNVAASYLRANSQLSITDKFAIKERFRTNSASTHGGDLIVKGSNPLTNASPRYWVAGWTGGTSNPLVYIDAAAAHGASSSLTQAAWYTLDFIVNNENNHSVSIYNANGSLHSSKTGITGRTTNVNNYFGFYGNSGYTYSVDWLLVRKIANVEPIINLGAEENYTSFIFVDCGSTAEILCSQTTDGEYTINTYTLIGTTTASTTWIPPTGANEIEYLIVAGGGGGAFNPYGGGGGAGGVLRNEGSLLTISGDLTITVGAGGVGTTAPGGNGSNSSLAGSGFTTLTAIGGGGGGKVNTATQPSGGSGGGAAGNSGAVVSGGTGTAGQGNNGGGNGSSVAPYPAGGGGGAGAVGGTGSGSQSGAGGNGITSSITGSAVVYAGGGGGAGENSCVRGLGGTGGGGNGGSSTVAATAGTNGLGGGGGGGSATGANGGNGGSGVVIIRYAVSDPAPTITSVSISTADSNVCKLVESEIVCSSGQAVTFNSVATHTEAIKLYICKDSTCTNCGISSTSNCWAYSSVGSASNPTAIYTPSSCGNTVNSYWSKVCTSTACSDVK
jgi:hypothetical protein